MLALGYKRRSVSTRKALAMLGIALVVASLIAPLIIKRVERETMKSSYDERAALMQMAINVIRANPVFRVGPGAYVLSYKRYLTTELEDKWQWQVHNYYLLRTAENGIFAGIAVFVLLLVALRTCWALSVRSHPMFARIGTGGRRYRGYYGARNVLGSMDAHSCSDAFHVHSRTDGRRTFDEAWGA